MANGYVQVPPDSTGKKMQTFENTISAQVVESEAVVLTASAGTEIGTSGAPVRAASTGTTVQPAALYQAAVAVGVANPLYVQGALTTSGTVTATLAAETTKVIGTVNQGTSPWVVSGAVTTSGTVAATLAAETNKVIGTVNQGTSPWVVSGAVTLTSTTITGTVAATESGTWTVQPGNTPNTTPWLVTSAGTISNASSGVATTSLNQATVAYNYGFNGTSWDQLQVDTSKYLKINCVTGCAGGSGGTSAVDEAAFTWGTTNFTPMGGFYQTTATSNPLTTGQSGAWQMTAQRAGFVNVRNASGTELGTSSNPFVIDTPASGNLYGAVTSGAGATGSAVPASGVYMGANKSGNLAGLTVDSSGYLQVNVAAGGGSGGTSSSFGSAFPATGTAIGLTAGTDMRGWPGDLTNGGYVNVKTSVLPTGAATSAIQATQQTSLTTIASTTGPTTWGGGTLATANAAGAIPVINLTATPIACTALCANLVVKASAGTLYSFEVSADSTLSAAAWWIAIYNATSAPADGASQTPIKCYAAPSGSTSFTGAFASGGIVL